MPNVNKYDAVILDWAGTAIDHGCQAPARVFREIFAARGVEVTNAEVRAPMGRAKIDHIAAVANSPGVAARWLDVHGQAPSEEDVRCLYADFLPLQKQILAKGCEPIAGVVEVISDLRAAGVAIGSTTGYTRELMDVVVPLAAEAGYAPDVIVCSDEVIAGRPAPWQIFRAAEALGVYPMDRVLVVDDTTVGIEAGVHAGAVSVGVTLTSNKLGLTAEQAAGLAAGAKAKLLAPLEAEFRAAGAHHVLESAADLAVLFG